MVGVTDFDLIQDWDIDLPGNDWDEGIIEPPPPPPPPGGGGGQEGTGKWKYYTVGLLNQLMLAEIPFRAPKFSSGLKDIGNYDADLTLGDKRLRKIDPVTNTIPERTALFAEFDGALVWGGIIWAAPYESDSKKLKVHAEEFGSFYTRQQIDGNGLSYTQFDQLEIARRIILFVRGKRAEANIHTIVTGYTPGSGRLRDRTYHGYEFKDAMEAIDQLSEVIDGFDWHFDVRYGSANEFEHTLTLSYPSRGAGPNTTALVLDFPGNIIKYSFPNDQSDRATKTTALGAGEGNKMLKASATDEASLAAGWPLTETTYSYKDIIKQNTLQGHADRDIKYLGDRFTGLKVRIPLTGDPRFGTYVIGDDALVQIKDERFPKGITGIANQRGILRLVGWTVDPEANVVDLELASTVER